MKEYHHQSIQSTCKTGHTILKESCRHCQTLKKEWYNILENADFDDIEKRLSSVEGDLSQRKDFQTIDQYEAKLNYFSWASQMLEFGNFKSMKDQMIWEYHTEGLSRRTISARIGLNDRWCSRKILQIRDYLVNTTASQCAVYG